MPSKAKRAKEQKWKLARNAVWGCVPARLGSEVPATWVPATELVPGGERAPWSSSTWVQSVWSAGQEAWTQVGTTGVSTRLFGDVRVIRYRVGRAWYVLAQPKGAIFGFLAPPPHPQCRPRHKIAAHSRIFRGLFYFLLVLHCWACLLMGHIKK